MEWLPPPLDAPTESHALHRLSFDLIRASIIARQSASTTCRALASAHHRDKAATAATDAAPANAPALRLLSGAGQANEAHLNPGGSFAALFNHRPAAASANSPAHARLAGFNPGAPPDGQGKFDA